MPVVGMVLVSPLFAYTIIQFTAVTTEMHDTETFKLYSEREKFWLYNHVSVYVSQQSMITNDAEFNILSVTKKEKKRNIQ